MLFSSLEFVFFVPVGIALYWALRWPTAQRVFIIVLTGLFLAFPGLFHLWLFAGVLAATTLLVAAANLLAGGYRRGVLIAGVVGLAATLAYFKLVPPQPLGLSYYSFVLIGFLLEGISRERLRPLRLVPMVAFFPILLSGPIVRWRAWSVQFGRQRKRHMARHLTSGAQLFMVGAFKKILMADVIAVSTAPVWASPGDYTRPAIALTLFAFYLQVYADFSGYTDMARGLARMMGFRLPINFKAPYLAVTPLEFWSRWHMSLTGWIRDHMFTPLSVMVWRRLPSPRFAPLLTFALLVTLMILVGLWHGVTAAFVVFGALHGAMIGAWYAVVGTGRRMRPAQRLASALLFQLLLLFSLVLFRSNTLSAGGAMLSAVATSAGTATLDDAVIGLGVVTAAVFWLQTIEQRAGVSPTGRRLATWRSRIALFPLFVLGIFGIYYMKGLTLEGVWIPPGDPYFNQGLEKFIYLQF